MMHSASLYKIIAVVLVAFLFVPQTVLASTNVSVSDNGEGSDNSVTVNQQTSGQSTVCVNGQCTSEGGNSKSTVCINGQCTTSDDGNVDMQSDDGHNQVHIHNTTADPTITPQQTGDTNSGITGPTPTSDPTLTPDPTIAQMRKDITNKVQQQDNAISSFIKSEVDALKNFLNGLFK